MPRHCDHNGFGLQDLHRAMTGPAYARRLADRAAGAGVCIRLSTTVAEVASDGSATLVGPDGIDVVRPRPVLLATGARERPRSARLVPGDRPAGVFTTGQLQQWVLLAGLPVGRRAVVVGAEHVAYSAVLTLRHAGVRTVAMVTVAAPPPDACRPSPGRPGSASGSRCAPRPGWPRCTDTGDSRPSTSRTW